jgi:hypothetical protein
MVNHAEQARKDHNKQIAKEIMIAYIQAGGPTGHVSLFPKQDRDGIPSVNFEIVGQRILKTVSE